jgi:RecA-family ATPase
VGKSFIAIDMALSVASGRPWQGHVTRQGFVLYIAAEGGTGITKRVAAWLKTRVIPASQLAAAWLMEAIPVYNDSTDLERVLERVETEIQTKPTLVVVDTLARCFDGNENEQLDMGRFIKGIDRMRHDFDATVMIVHHTRLDGDRERGNTAFRGAADAMLSVSRGHGGFNLTSVAGTDSCVVTVDTRKAKKAQKTSEIIHILRTQGPLTWDAWYQFAQSHGVSKATFARHVHELRETNQILKEKGQWRVFSDDLVSLGNDE